MAMLIPVKLRPAALLAALDEANPVRQIGRLRWIGIAALGCVLQQRQARRLRLRGTDGVL